jgi:hypothetical protein
MIALIEWEGKYTTNVSWHMVHRRFLHYSTVDIFVRMSIFVVRRRPVEQ